MKIIEYQDDYEEEWDSFVVKSPESRFVHLTGFKKLIENFFCYSPCYWLVKEKDKILAVFAGFLCRGFLGGKRLISQPFSEYGGILFNPDLSRGELEKACRFLSEQLKKKLENCNLKLLEIHNAIFLPEEIFEEYFKKQFLYKYAVLELDSSGNLWQKKLNYEVKKAINKAENNQIKIFHGVNGEIIEEKFYPFYLISMKRFGSPPHRLNYFLDCYKYLKDNMEFFWAELEGKPIAGLLGWKCGQRIQITDTVSDPRFWGKRPNDLLHWEFIKWAAKENFKHFDFGPVRYEGQAHYKLKWGCNFYDYHYYYLTTNKNLIIKKPLDDRNPLIQKLSFLWRKIVPLRLTPWLGEGIRKQLAK